MNLRSGLPFSLIKFGLPFDYPKLEKSLSTDVVIMGGGISGALVAYYLIKEGINCIVIDKRTIGLGSTCASTALLQYEIDVPLFLLIKKIGNSDAVRAYELCKESIEKIKMIAGEIGATDFEMKKSLYFAARRSHKAFLQKEFSARKENGFAVEWMEKKAVKDRFDFAAPAAILSDHGAQVNAYLLTHHLLQNAIKKGVQVFDRTNAINIQHEKNGVMLKTETGFRITSKKLVYATGYEVIEFIGKKIVQLHSTYATVSEHMTGKESIWKDDVIMWNTNQPYLYLRTTSDRRILIGGRDEKFSTPEKRDRLIEKKSQQLTSDFKKLFPDIPFKPEFSWTGIFGHTEDGLPFIGTYPKLPHGYFALGFGGNGITFSQIAAQIIADLFTGKKNDDARIFSFDRV